MRKILGKIYCCSKAIKDLIIHHVWIPHVYTQSLSEAIIIATDKSFRISKNYFHNSNERVYPKAGLITYKGIYCGHTEYGWVSNFPKDTDTLDLPII